MIDRDHGGIFDFVGFNGQHFVDRQTLPLNAIDLSIDRAARNRRRCGEVGIVDVPAIRKVDVRRQNG